MPAPIEISLSSSATRARHQPLAPTLSFTQSQSSTPILPQSSSLFGGVAFEFDSELDRHHHGRHALSSSFSSTPQLDHGPAREFESAFCRDFFCCGLTLMDLHDLLQHYEECHVRFEEDDVDFAEVDDDFFDDEPWSDSDTDSLLGTGTTAAVGLKVNQPLYHHPQSTQRQPFPLPHQHQYSTNNTFSNSTSNALDAFSASFVGPSKRKAVVSLSDIYSEDDSDLNNDPSAFSDIVLRSRANLSGSDTKGPQFKRQAIESNQRSLPGSIYSDSNSSIHQDTAVKPEPLPVIHSGHPLFKSHSTGHGPLGIGGREGMPSDTAIFAGLPTKMGMAGPLSNRLPYMGPPSDMSTSPYVSAAVDLMRHRDEVLSIMEDMAKPGNGSSGDKPYRCSVLGCDKAYKNPNGLKYHNLHGHCSTAGMSDTDSPETKPYVCSFLECGKRYKNLNGLKYHIEHSHPNLVVALRAHQSGLNHPHLFGPYPNQATMAIAAALAAVQASPMMMAAANAILTAQQANHGGQGHAQGIPGPGPGPGLDPQSRSGLKPGAGPLQGPAVPEDRSMAMPMSQMSQA